MDDLDRPGEIRGFVLNDDLGIDQLLRELADLGVTIVKMPVVCDEQHQFRVLAVEHVFAKRVPRNRKTDEKLSQLVWRLRELAERACLDELDACGHGGDPFTATIRCEVEGGYVMAEEIHHRQPFVGLRNNDTVVLRTR
jgi:hypothetical protein